MSTVHYSWRAHLGRAEGDVPGDLGVAVVGGQVEVRADRAAVVVEPLEQPAQRLVGGRLQPLELRLVDRGRAPSR